MRVPGLLIALLAVVVAVVPSFYNCTANGGMLTTTTGKQVPMKCFWTAVAEIAVGAPLVAVGGMLAFSKKKETRRNMAIMGGILGAFVMLLPTYLIGTCQSPDMICNLVLRPTVLFSGALIMAISLGTLVFSERMAEAVA